jgi:hypothetical protein
MHVLYSRATGHLFLAVIVTGFVFKYRHNIRNEHGLVEIEQPVNIECCSLTSFIYSPRVLIT